MKTSILKSLSVGVLFLFCAVSFAFAATECSIVPASIPWDEGDQGTWASGVYPLTIECSDSGSPVEGYQAQFDISLMGGTDWGTKLWTLTVYSTRTNSSGIAQIVVPLIHILRNDNQYIHICPFDDIQCTGGEVISSLKSASSQSSAVASFVAANTTGCTNTNTLPGCCETTITVTCCDPVRVFTFCTTVPASQCSVGTFNPDPCTTIFTQYAPGGICDYCTGKCDLSTAITLSSFTAKPFRKTVILKWTTETEIDNAGFNIYRANSKDGEFVKINSELIPAEAGAVAGASYQFIDSTVQNRFKTYYYKLADVDLNGFETIHEPAVRVWCLPTLFK